MDAVEASAKPGTSEAITFTFNPSGRRNAVRTSLQPLHVAQWLHEAESAVENSVVPVPPPRQDREWLTECTDKCGRKTMAHGNFPLSLSVCLLFLMCLVFPGTFLYSTHQGTKEEEKKKEERKKEKGKGGKGGEEQKLIFIECLCPKRFICINLI